MPTSRADSGIEAAARIASPIGVKRKNRNSSTSSISVTPIMPAWWVEISWLPRNGEDPNGVGILLDGEVPDQAGDAVEDREQRDETGDDWSGSALWPAA